MIIYRRMMMTYQQRCRSITTACVFAILLVSSPGLFAQTPSSVLDLWPAKPPGENKELPPEADQTKPEDKLIAGRRIIKLGNVSVPQIALFKPPAELDNGTSVIICPGGGHHILAYDLEGTEVAQWLNSIGVTGIVLKYRVPFRDPEERWRAAVQDAQRAISITRSKAKEWGIRPDRIGVCGFSAGGETAALASLFTARQYEPIDSADQISHRPDFAILIYPARLISDQKLELRSDITIDDQTPPMFMTHAYDDGVSVQNSILLASALKAADRTAELHVFATGGHGFGLRRTDSPITQWPDLADKWLQQIGMIPKSSE